MRFASVRIAEEWKHGTLSLTLRGVVADAADFAQELYQWDFLITCLLRTPEENDALYGSKGKHLTGVHVLGRGADIRTKDVDHDAVMGVVGYVNERYQYDPDRPLLHVALFEDGKTAGSAQHLHLQVSGNTRMRHFVEDEA